jgi:2-iminobutanoate/2-iminopropanoate deaminase
MTRTAGILTDGPAPGGPYSASARIGTLVAVSGQCGYLPDRSLVEGIEAQTHVTLQNLQAALQASGASADDVLSVEVFLTDVDHFAAMNAVYEQFFTRPYPARTTIYVGLRAGVLVEISALAVTDTEVER